jgi:ATP-dependent helicase/nuclease subunit A
MSGLRLDSWATATALTDEQQQAVTRRGESLLLAAGAGSGKTSVLVERFVCAVREDQVAPGRILAITFTERAAGELRERVRGRLLELGEREAARDSEGAFVSTIHGFCARLLRHHAIAAGLHPQFTILEEGLARRLRTAAFAGALQRFLARELDGAIDLLAAFGNDGVRSIVCSAYAELRSQGQSLPRLPIPSILGDGAPTGTDLRGAQACLLLNELLQEFGRAYAERKHARGALDFDDLELCARSLLEDHAGVRAQWSERFELIMVDEFQDTNARQLAILTALARENLLTVGDELQSIYGFRHADVELFRRRRAQLDGRGASLALTHNFRSAAPLLAAINAVFSERFGDDFTPLVPGREQLPAAEHEQPVLELLLTDKRGWEQAGAGAEALDIGGQLPAATAWRHAEARLLAQRIADLISAGEAAPGEVAVLVRATGDLPVYERALEERGLATLAAVGGFWGAQQIGDLIAYLRVLANPLDEQALYSTLASPLVGLSSDALALLALAARSERVNVWDGLQANAAPLLAGLPRADRDRMASFQERLASERRTLGGRTIAELIERAIDASGYVEHVVRLSWGERRLANIHKLLRLARRFEAQEGRDLRGFLDAYEQEALDSSEPDAPVADGDLQAVRLMSVHAAKGLEFPVVCVADLGRAANIGAPALLVDRPIDGGPARIGLRLDSLDGSPAVATLDYDQLREQRLQAEAAEEQRILYVAMTRARERLLLSGALAFASWPQEAPGAPAIAWLGPAVSRDLPRRVGEAALEPLQELRVGGGAGTRALCWLNAPSTLGRVLRLESLTAVDDNLERGAGVDVGSAHEPGAGGELSDVADGGFSPVTDPPIGAAGDFRAADGAPSESGNPLTESGDALSYTALTELERCGYRYYLEHVLGLPEDRQDARRAAAAAAAGGGSLGARERGILIHRLLESVDFARAITPTAERCGELARELGLRLGVEERARIAQLVARICNSPLAARLAAATDLRREHPFAFTAGAHGPSITGVLDVIAREPDGGVLIVDYKSDRVLEQDDLEQLVARDYPIQRLLYALAALHDGAPRVEVVHWFLERPHESISAHFDAARAAELERELVARIARASKFTVSKAPHRGLCLTCPGRTTLCSWDQTHTLRESPLQMARGQRRQQGVSTQAS